MESSHTKKILLFLFTFSALSTPFAASAWTWDKWWTDCLKKSPAITVACTLSVGALCGWSLYKLYYTIKDWNKTDENQRPATRKTVQTRQQALKKNLQDADLCMKE